MGCINSTGQFSHWFANIHLSGPCNRRCYFCIGQHMMALDPFNNLDTWPLAGSEDFALRCAARGIDTVYVTGTNTDPLLYRHTEKLREWADRNGWTIGVRTNGVALPAQSLRWALYDKASITICSFDKAVNRAMMGGDPVRLANILCLDGPEDVKVNIVLGPENRDDVHKTIAACERLGIKRINLREPYGQPHVGNPLATHTPESIVLGMPEYRIGGASVVYWDVHFVEVESVNLYASGRVSETYPITRGCADDGVVIDQTAWTHSGRVREQWVESGSVVLAVDPSVALTKNASAFLKGNF